MSANDADFRSDSSSTWARKIAGLSWQAIRLPLLAFLVLVEPVARFVLTAVGLIGLVVAVFLRFSGVVPRFPFWSMVAASIACGVSVIALNAVMRQLAR